VINHKSDDSMMPTNTYQGYECETCKELNIDCQDCPECSSGVDSEVAMAMYDSSIGKSECCPEDISKQAPCWDGYVQRGMKPGADGKPVPNCVPAEKSDEAVEDPSSFAGIGKDYTRSTTNIYRTEE
jgi:hypothetical protein